ncbi:efflux RND transporter periplasmic adaptor subunit [Nocardioides sp. YIM 152315]|uniref:efflux RND transporter periplasmic adaptor subunit n=1 Tax=Nocardioides sp. YIM 152315 TaxID=3031760 RepID=UPI0023DAA6C3|nr:efflux RND transporter periplasmic adaptor subunit [Nocardioides sp. YIM 152315]MDF1602709.1 efflux RND transporter periplasmic adaptor subunit [Nocardioides sp. YIM 152315]
MRLPARRRSRILLACALVVLVAVASSGAWLLIRDSSQAASSTTATVSTETVRDTVTADGTVAASTTADESFAVAGTVTRVAVAEGDRVRKGEVLAVVDDAGLVATRRAAQSSYDAALAQLDEDEDAGASDVQLASDRAAIVSARASLADARRAVEDATLRASIRGTVTAVGLSKGDTVGSGAAGADAAGAGDTTDSTSGTISIVATGTYVVDATVAAADVDSLKKGLQAEVAVTGVTDTVYGTVEEVGLVAETNDSGAAAFPVTIGVTGRRKDLYAGVSATATIITRQRQGVLTVTSRALSTEDGATYATRLEDGDETRVEVETGETFGMTTEVLSGLEDGDTVVVPGFERIVGGGGDEGGQQGAPDGGEPPALSELPGGGQGPTMEGPAQ